MKNGLINKRSLRFGSFSFVLTVLVVAAAIILNVVVGMDPVRNKLKFDLTGNKLYSVGEETTKVLDGLDQEVEIIGLFDDTQMTDPKYSQVMEFIKQYEAKNNKIHVRYVDPDKNPGYISELDPKDILGIDKYDFVVKSEKRSKVLSTYDIFEQTMDERSYSYYVSGLNAEYAFTGAIRFVTAEEIPVIYYTGGHGEGSLETAYTGLKSDLELNGYELKAFNLATVETVPQDAAIVLFTGPKQDISIAEREKLTIYMENGGNTVFLIDPIQTNTKLSNFEEFLAEYNIGLGYDVVFEMAANRAAPSQPYYFMPTVEDNTINTNLNPDQFSMFMLNARSIKILNNQKEWITSTPLLATSAEAVGMSLDESVENTPGPMNIAVAVENKGKMKPTKTLVVGNAYFASDEGMSINDSGEKFLLNALNWMQNKETDIYIPVKSYTSPVLENITQQTMTLLFIGLIIVVPLIIIGIGVFIWLRRRHL